MRILSKLALAATMTLGAAGSASAAFWTCPEIDGPAGISAIAAIAAVGMIAYDRLRS